MGFAKAQNFLIKQVKTRYFFSTQPDIDISINSILNLKKTIIKFKKDCILAVPNINDQKNIIKIDKNDNNKEFKIIQNWPYGKVLEEMAQAEGFVYLPPGGDTCPRMVIEAKLLGCELVLNDLVEHKNEIWFAH